MSDADFELYPGTPSATDSVSITGASSSVAASTTGTSGSSSGTSSDESATTAITSSDASAATRDISSVSSVVISSNSEGTATTGEAPLTSGQASTSTSELPSSTSVADISSTAVESSASVIPTPSAAESSQSSFSSPSESSRAPSSTETASSSILPTSSAVSATDSSAPALSSTSQTGSSTSSAQPLSTSQSEPGTTSAAQPSSIPSAAPASPTSAAVPLEKRFQVDIPSPAPTPFAWRRSIPKRDDPFSFIDNFDNADGPANDEDFQELSEQALNNAENQKPTTNGTQISTAPDAGLVNIKDKSGSYSLFGDADGNLYIDEADQGSQFAEVQGFVVGDDVGRFLHYYPDTMAAYNVSRLRLSDQDEIPKTADFVALVPADYNDNPSTPDIYAAFDTIGGFFFTISCDIEDQASKIFLAADPVEGAKTLMDPKLRYTVTGGVVTECYYLPWVRPAQST